MSRIAHEVSRRMTPEYAKGRAREMARDRMYRARDRAVESTWLAPLLGAGVGALVARALQSRAQERSWEDRGRRGDGWRGDGYARGSYGSAYREDAEYRDSHDLYGSDLRRGDGDAAGAMTAGETGSTVGERASEMKDRARATASEVKDRARETAAQVKGRFREATSSMRDRLPDRDRLRESAREDTGLWALGALALGALFGFALPETEREREMLEPARRKARALGAQARDTALAKGAAAMEKATDEVGSLGTEPRGAQPGSSTSGAPGTDSQPATPIH